MLKRRVKNGQEKSLMKFYTAFIKPQNKQENLVHQKEHLEFGEKEIKNKRTNLLANRLVNMRRDNKK